MEKECINVKFSEGLGIFDGRYGFPEIDDKEIHNGPTGKVKDIQGIQAHAGRIFLTPEGFLTTEGKEFSFDIDQCPYLHIAIKAREDTDTCLFLMVNDKPSDHIGRFVVIGKTPKGDPGPYDIVKDCFTIEDDDIWHEYDFDLRKIRENYPNAGSIDIIQFYSWTGSGKHIFHFNDLVCKPEQPTPLIKSIIIMPTLAKVGDKIKVIITEEPGAHASFSIDQVSGATDVPMKELPGISDLSSIYEGIYNVQDGDDVKNAEVTVVFTSRSGETVCRKAEQTVTIDTTPPNNY